MTFPRPTPQERPVAESKWVLRGCGVLVAAAVLSLFPIVPTHSACRAIYEERLRYARAPQLSVREAAEIRAVAEKWGCGTCGNSGRVSIFRHLQDHDWDPWSFLSARYW